jgi:hypothetical protein
VPEHSFAAVGEIHHDMEAAIGVHLAQQVKQLDCELGSRAVRPTPALAALWLR